MVKKVLIMAGGTGGHVFPALVIAQKLKERGIDVFWLGTEKGIENGIIPDAHIPLYVTTVSGVRGKSLGKLVFGFFQLIKAIYQSWKIIRTINPDIVLGMGGFASAPGGVAAWLCRKPLVIHEQNAVLGLANRVLSHFACSILLGFPEKFTQRFRKSIPIKYVGNPVRETIVALPDPKNRFLKHNQERLKLLIMGGSQGSLSFNQVIPAALKKLSDEERPIIWHQAGKKQIEIAKKTYHSFGVDAKIEAFISDMAQAYEWADLVICRAGASTIAELTAGGVPAILIPFPYAADDHQSRNARFLEEHQAGILLSQSLFESDKLINLLKWFLHHRQERIDIACSARQLRKTDAVEEIIQVLLEEKK